jgi:hypothetical protein
MTNNEITKELVLDRLDYNPESGLITWKKVVRKQSTVGRVTGSLDVSGYVQVNIGGGHVMKGHRIAWLFAYGDWPDGHIDHINGDRADNRIANLRVVTNAINCQNKRKPLPSNKSGYLGVSWSKNVKKWLASCMLNRKQYRAGYFDDPEVAHQAYLKLKRELHEGCTI